MKQLFVIIIAMLAGMFLESRAQEKQGGVEEFSVNGLKVILKTIDANQIVSVQLYLRGGSLNLTEATQGIEALLFDCAAKGSQRYPKEKLNALLDRTAASINSTALKDFSSINLRCLKQDFDALWDAYTDVVMHPTFVPADVEVVRNSMLLGIKQRKDNPDSYLNEVADQVFYAGHPYSLDPAGMENSVASITIDQMRKYLSEHLVTSRLLLVVVGNVEKGMLQSKVSSSFGTLSKGDYTPVFPKPVVHSGPTVKIIERQLPTTYIRGCFALPAPGSPGFYATMVMMNIVRTRIWEEVRTKRNLSYAPSAGLANSFANQGSIYVSSVLPDSAVKVMIAELKKMQNDPVSAKDLKDRITMFLTGYYTQRETNASQGQFLAFHELSGLGWKAAEDFIERVRRVTAADIQGVAKQYFQNLQSVVIGDPKLVNEKAFEF
jgi:zinc protease